MKAKSTSRRVMYLWKRRVRIRQVEAGMEDVVSAFRGPRSLHRCLSGFQFPAVLLLAAIIFSAPSSAPELPALLIVPRIRYANSLFDDDDGLEKRRCSHLRERGPRKVEGLESPASARACITAASTFTAFAFSSTPDGSTASMTDDAGGSMAEEVASIIPSPFLVYTACTPLQNGLENLRRATTTRDDNTPTPDHHHRTLDSSWTFVFPPHAFRSNHDPSPQDDDSDSTFANTAHPCQYPQRKPKDYGQALTSPSQPSDTGISSATSLSWTVYRPGLGHSTASTNAHSVARLFSRSLRSAWVPRRQRHTDQTRIKLSENDGVRGWHAIPTAGSTALTALPSTPRAATLSSTLHYNYCATCPAKHRLGATFRDTGRRHAGYAETVRGPRSSLGRRLYGNLLSLPVPSLITLLTIATVTEPHIFSTPRSSTPHTRRYPNGHRPQSLLPLIV
ncbi:hypothetical protein C8F01DRAFT_1253689 [Mycena amicta]|nr:hypothetical protein C8F01DRAFT_1253689 [Mycena amicta]